MHMEFNLTVTTLLAFQRSKCQNKFLLIGELDLASYALFLPSVSRTMAVEVAFLGIKNPLVDK